MATHRSRTWIFAIIIVVIVILVIVFVPHENQHSVTEVISTTTPPTLEQKMVVTSNTIKDYSKADNYQITVTYPQVSGLTNSDAQIKINKDISDNIDSVISDFKQPDPNASAPIPGADPSTLDVSYSIQSNTTIPNLISIRVIESTFDSAAAHPAQFVDTWNYNTSTGAKISLDDIFSATSTVFLPRLSAYTRAELQRKLGDDPSLSDQIDQGTTPDEDNFSSFVFSDTGLIFIFQEYQVAAYTSGVQEVLVPYSEIKDILNQKGPLAFLFAQ